MFVHIISSPSCSSLVITINPSIFFGAKGQDIKKYIPPEFRTATKLNRLILDQH